MHSPCGRKAEFVGGGREDLFYFERILVFGHEFPRRVVEVQVFVIEPDFISNFPQGKAGVYVVLHKKGSFFMGGDGFFPSFKKKIYIFSLERKVCLILG